MRALVTPRPGRLVLVPGNDQPLPAEGLEVVWSNYWQRRRSDGDVDVQLLHDAPTPPPAPEVKDPPSPMLPAKAAPKAKPAAPEVKDPPSPSLPEPKALKAKPKSES